MPLSMCQSNALADEAFTLTKSLPGAGCGVGTDSIASASVLPYRRAVTATIVLGIGPDPAPLPDPRPRVASLGIVIVAPERTICTLYVNDVIETLTRTLYVVKGPRERRRKEIKIAASSARRVPLTRERIVAHSVRIADEHGVSGLSMRSLARSLGFEVMALYNHIANKQELLSLMIDAVASTIEGPPSGVQPLDAVRSMTISTHAALLKHPWVTELWQQHLPGLARTAHMETLLRLLNESGLSPELAHHGFHAVTNHVIGYTLQEATMVLAGRDALTTAEDFLAGISWKTHPYMVAHVNQHLSGNSASSFELVLDLILDGLVRLDVARPVTSP